MIEITYQINHDDHLLNEPASQADNLFIAEVLKSGDIINGILTIKDTKSGEIFSLEDELEPLIMNLCFVAPYKLLEDKKYTYLIFSYAGKVVFSCDDKMIAIQRESITVSFSKTELLAWLYACGVRYTKLMRDAELPDYQANIDYLETYRVACEKALVDNNLL